MARGYKGRDDGFMIELQPVPDARPMFEKLIGRDELAEMGERDDDEWAAVWEAEGYSPDDCSRLRRAFADLESAWLVFWVSRDPDRALWRLVDAAGQLAEMFPEARGESTGRGYRIEKIAPFSSGPHRWGDQKPAPAVAYPPRLAPLRSVDAPRAARPRPVALDPRRTFSRLQKAEIFLRSNGHCCGCGRELGDVWHADHWMPHSRGGLTEVRNGIALCVPCNQRKSDQILCVDDEGRDD